MHLLKRLELNGFKSFAGKTVLDFPSGITAIVGPNGSGKSNIVDAFRWLLGERDAKHLRGGKVEDLIFAGTPERSRSGMATASLFFENLSNSFPIDAPEVTVGREVTRDGSSRYFINKSEVLLRDLIDFFAHARLGSRGLVVVTQGNSDLFIRAEAKTRREMIEEILGLREYQLKKSDAERRLSQSEENMRKAEALIEEILPHLRSLRRQANRWEKRGALEDELKELENQYFGFALKSLETEKNSLNELEKNHDNIGGEIQKALQTAQENEKQIEMSQPEERKELTSLRKETSLILENRNVLERQVAKLEAQIEVVGEEESDDEYLPSSEIMKVVERVRELLLAAEDADVEELQNTIQTALDELESLFVRRSAHKESKSRNLFTEELQSFKKDLFELNKKLSAHKSREQELEKSQEDFYKIFTAAVREVERVRNSVREWESANQELRIKKERITLHHDELVKQIRQAGREPGEFSSVTFGEHAETSEIAERKMLRLRGELAAIGEIDQAVMKEANDTEVRYEFLTREAEDLKKAVADLRKLIRDLNEKIKTEFTSALRTINEEFNKFFNLMFDGGHAKLKVQNAKIKIQKDENQSANLPEVEAITHPGEMPEENDEDGIEIEFKLPRKKANTLEVLSGGERSLVGIAALFALISVSPPPFLVLDEIDAALDERNARRFADLLAEFSKKTQFIVVTHNRATMESADVLYGVTLGPDGTSKVLSVELKTAQ